MCVCVCAWPSTGNPLFLWVNWTHRDTVRIRPYKFSMSILHSVWHIQWKLKIKLKASKTENPKKSRLVYICTYGIWKLSLSLKCWTWNAKKSRSMQQTKLMWKTFYRTNKINEENKIKQKEEQYIYEPAGQFNWTSFRNNNIRWRFFWDKIWRNNHIQMANLSSKKM